jgi:hypothetical protein
MIAVGIEETNRDRHHAPAAQLRRDLRHLVGIDVGSNRAVGERPLSDAEGQVGGYQRLGEFNLQIVDVVTVFGADRQHVLETLSNEERRHRTLPFDQCVRRRGRCVNDQAADIRRCDLSLAENAVNAVEKALKQVAVRGQRLVDPQPVVVRSQDDIGERAADIDGEGIGIHRPRASRHQLTRVFE